MSVTINCGYFGNIPNSFKAGIILNCDSIHLLFSCKSNFIGNFLAQLREKTFSDKMLYLETSFFDDLGLKLRKIF